MIQDIEPRLNNAYKKVEKKKTDVLLSFDGRNVFYKRIDDEAFFLTREVFDAVLLKERIASDEEEIYLFSIGDRAFYLITISDDIKDALLKEGYAYGSLFGTRSLNEKEKVFAFATGFHLSEWYRTTKYCGACGHRLIHEESMRAKKCEHCGNMVFPKINPAVIVAVRNGEDILLTTYAGREYKNYALVAGFMEIGESAEETVEREVFEETGIRVKNITYYKSQPWGFESDVLLGFYCDADGDTSLRIDEEELATAEWVNRKDMEPRKDNLSLTSEMMEAFRTGII